MPQVYCVRCKQVVDDCDCLLEAERHILEHPATGPREHIISPDCWCMPVCEYEDEDCKIWVHNLEN